MDEKARTELRYVLVLKTLLLLIFMEFKFPASPLILWTSVGWSVIWQLEKRHVVKRHFGNKACSLKALILLACRLLACQSKRHVMFQLIVTGYPGGIWPWIFHIFLIKREKWRFEWTYLRLAKHRGRWELFVHAILE